MSHSSFFLSFRLSVRVLLHGLWQNDTKSAGHWYLVVFLAVDARNNAIIISPLIQQHLFKKNTHYGHVWGNHCNNEIINKLLFELYKSQHPMFISFW